MSRAHDLSTAAVALLGTTAYLVFFWVASAPTGDNHLALRLSSDRAVEVSCERPHVKTEARAELGRDVPAGTLADALMMLQRQPERGIRPLRDGAVADAIQRALAATMQQQEILSSLAASLTPEQDAILRHVGLPTYDLSPEGRMRHTPLASLDEAIEALADDARATLALHGAVSVQKPSLSPRRQPGEANPQILLSIVHLALKRPSPLSARQRALWSARLAVLRRQTTEKRCALREITAHLSDAQQAHLTMLLESHSHRPASLSYQVAALARLLGQGAASSEENRMDTPIITPLLPFPARHVP